MTEGDWGVYASSMNIIYPTLKFQEFPNVEVELERLLLFFRETDLKHDMTITLAEAEVDGTMVRNYEAKIVSRFTDAGNDDLYIGTADGHFVNISQTIADAKAKLKN